MSGKPNNHYDDTEEKLNKFNADERERLALLIEQTRLRTAARDTKSTENDAPAPRKKRPTSSKATERAAQRAAARNIAVAEQKRAEEENEKAEAKAEDTDVIAENTQENKANLYNTANPVTLLARTARKEARDSVLRFLSNLGI